MSPSDWSTSRFRRGLTSSNQNAFAWNTLRPNHNPQPGHTTHDTQLIRSTSTAHKKTYLVPGKRQNRRHPPDPPMEVSSHTLSATSCFIAVKLTFNKTRAANTPKTSKKNKGRVPPSQTQGGSAGKQGSSSLGINEVAFKSLILGALESLHGELGAVGYLVDVLSWDPVSGEGRLRVNARSLVPIRAALSLVGSYGNTPCAISVTAASPFLAGLACERYL